MVAQWRAWGLVVSAALLVVSALIGVVGGKAQATSQLDKALVSAAAEHSTILAEYFERARAIDLLLAQSPAFTSAEDIPTRQEHHPAAEAALAYLEEVYPGHVGEACLIDARGTEHARVVHGKAAAAEELSTEEASAPFFAPTISLPPGRVYQAKPYLSPDTGTWVISNSTMVPDGRGASHAMVHFEVELSGFVPPGWGRDDGVNILIADRGTGDVLVDFAHGGVVAAGRALGRPGDAMTNQVVDGAETVGSLTVGERRGAFERIEAGADNANDWAVIAVSDRSVPLWAGNVAKAALGVSAAALALLVLSFVGLRRQQRDLKVAAETDPLTGLMNRRAFAANLHRNLTRAGDERFAAVLLVDLNGFKEINDTLGHHAGDVLLAEVARRLRGSMRPDDIVARLGGDEFAVVLFYAPGRFTVVLQAVERILDGIRRPFVLDDVGLRSDASVGIAVYPEHGSTGEELLQRADIAMYRAKEARVGHALYSAESDPHSPRRLQLISGLLQAIEARELIVHFQPKVRVDTGRVDGVEALVRWEHPRLGLLPPGEFVPLAETMGLMRPLTLCVLDQALSQARRWADQGIELPVAVNCSAADLGAPAFADEVAGLLSAHRVEASQLKLEITETMLLGDPDHAVRVLTRLHDMGVGLSMDDFGTGYSSMSYLRRLPLCEIKIDRTFVGGMSSDAADALIVRSTIDLGHSFGLTVVAEGVEDESTLESLRDFRCDLAQGYHLGRPVPADEFARWLSAQEQEFDPVGNDGSVAHDRTWGSTSSR